MWKRLDQPLLSRRWRGPGPEGGGLKKLEEAREPTLPQSLQKERSPSDTLLWLHDIQAAHPRNPAWCWDIEPLRGSLGTLQTPLPPISLNMTPVSQHPL